MISLQPGDVFCTRNPMALGRVICFVQKIHASDNQAEYSHSGVILDKGGTTFEALWTNKRQNLFRAYQGKKVLIGRHDKMTQKRFKRDGKGSNIMKATGMPVTGLLSS